ncbi:RrF2 family transcriptional regulator [Desulfolucanica intricata]|uniref:RrF2 family transcriptional regulator n=1 Tax=Desulfolucanica intricata TaxID=1285191 RepID=UPI000833A303|nr:Rrf2 family transcriptional regulator [Desulfolucanica intricata]
MQLTRKTEYAIRTLLELSQHPFGEILQTKLIASNRDIPEKFLSKTIQDLARAGFVHTIRGLQGGVRLVKPPEKITLAAVVAAIEGPLAINQCLGENGFCINKPHCKVHQVLNRAQNALLAELSSVTFAELAKP